MLCGVPRGSRARHWGARRAPPPRERAKHAWPAANELPPQKREPRRAVLEALDLDGLGLGPIHEELASLLDLCASRERALAWAEVPRIE